MAALLVHASAAFLVTIDPVGVATIFFGLASGRGRAERRHLALTGVLVAAGVLYVFALGGAALLGVLGISLAAFRIAGGALLFLLAIDMVLARPSGLRATTKSEDAEAHHRHDIAVFPLAIPLIAGPGAIASTMLLMGEARDWLERGAVLGVLALVLIATYFALRAAGALSRLLGVTGSNVVGRVLGIVLAALAVQFMLDGIGAVLSAKS